MILRILRRICCVFLALTVPGHLFAQADACNVERKAGSHALDEYTWKQLNAIYEDVGEERYEEAFEDLNRIRERAGRDAYLQAVVDQALAQVEWARGNYAESLRYFEQALTLDVLPDPVHFALMYQVAQLYYMQERDDEALEILNLWLCKVPEDRVTAAAWVLKASILVRRQDYPGVLQAIGTAIGMDENPKEQWFQLKLAAHYELRQYPEAADTLETLVVRWPGQKRYWTQLSQLYYQMNSNDRALAVMALAYRRNLLDQPADISYLSSLYSNTDVPYKAAQVLETGIADGIVPPTRRNWTLVADSWYAAEELEKALAAYDEAGEVADDGEIDLRRSHILVDLERWSEARAALNRALQKGGLDEWKMGEAHLLRGIAHFHLGETDQAIVDWQLAESHEKTRASASQWMKHLHEERQREP